LSFRSVVGLGGKVLTWTSDYLALADLLVRISEEFARTTGRTTYVLDLEYKKVAPGSRVLPAGGLVIKQVREIPSSDRTQTAFLLNEPTRFEVFPGEILEFEATDVFADHRLKSRWTLETRSMVLDANTLAEGLYTQVQIEYLDDDQVRTISGRMDLLPSSEHGFDGRDAVDCWRLDGIENPRTYRLTTPGIPTAVPAGQRPLLTVADLGAQGYNVPFRCLRLNVRYDQPVLSWRQSMSPSGAVVGSPGLRMTQENRVDLWRLTPPSANDIRQERTVSIDGISVKTSFYYPPLPPGQDMWGFLGGNTGPLKRWEQTVIEGLTATPIVLKGYYSQTFRPQHHNLVELFLFEPRLEPDISPEVLAELKQKGIRFIQVILDHTDTSASQILTHGFDAPPQS
jgi:hypothetical protein